ncbi:MAG: multicopper oxidase family protein [Actinomycetota bacterium]|nr:multicopper oxidase family protein [Actinomycetota bacterium]
MAPGQDQPTQSALTWATTVLSRRRALSLAGLAAVGVAAAACGASGSNRVGAGSSAVAQYAEMQRRRLATGRTITHTLTAAPGHADIGGVTSAAWLYDGSLPGPMLRGAVGDRMKLTVRNQLPESTTVHWHGVRVPNDMDGVPNVTQTPFKPGAEFTYDFLLPDAGTYWYHSHGELQRGRGLYGALLVDDPHDAGDYDTEFTVVLSDWLINRTPRQVYDGLKGGKMGGMASGSMGGMGSMSGLKSSVLGGDAGDVTYPVYLINGRQPAAPVTFTAKPGQRARIRLINAADDTTFRVALGGHQLEVIQSDGRAVSSVTGDALLIGMGERYDAIVTMADGVFPLVASAEGKAAQAFAVVSTGSGSAPDPGAVPRELGGRVLTVADLQAAEQQRLPARKLDVMMTGNLNGGMDRYTWTINGHPYPDNNPFVVRQGNRARLTFTNRTTMYHPMHLHGHTFQIARPDGSGPRKDTTLVLPRQSVSLDFETDNPGQWFTHCHNEYHMTAGMATVLSYHTQ